MLSHKETRKLIAYAAACLGGAQQLATKLGIPLPLLTHYMTGHKAMPDVLFLRLVDVAEKQLPIRASMDELRAKAQRLRTSLAALRTKNGRDLTEATATARTNQELRSALRALRRAAG